jgi:hypothetical protein
MTNRILQQLMASVRTGRGPNGQRRMVAIPEIMKAYQNDPRTQVAQVALQGGTSTAPTATGKYAYADGIARALQGALGGYMSGKQMDKYGADQADLLALRKARGQDGLTGAPLPGTTPTGTGASPPAPPAPPGAALGAPVSPVAGPDMGTAPSAPVGAPTAPRDLIGGKGPVMQHGPGPVSGGMPDPASLGVSPPGALPGNGTPIMPGMGGGPQGIGPFPAASPASRVPPPPAAATSSRSPVSSASGSFKGPGALSHVDVPDAPGEYVLPDAPKGKGPTRSKLLDAAYRIMVDANPYESAAGQDMYREGLAEQGKFDEANAEREDAYSRMGYQSKLQAGLGDRDAAWKAHDSAVERNYKVDDTNASFAHDSAENDKNRANQIQLERMRAASALQVAKVRESTSASGGTDITPEERAALSKAVAEHRIDLKGITKWQMKVIGQTLVDNPNLNAIELHALATMAANPAQQSKAALLQAMPTVIAQVRDAGKKVNMSDVQFVGKMQAAMKGQLNDPDFVNYMTQRNDAMQTLAQVMSGVGASDMRIRMESDAAPKTMSPRAWDAWYNAQMAALHPRVQIAERKGLVPKGTTEQLYGADTASPGPAKPGKTGNPLVDKYL